MKKEDLKQIYELNKELVMWQKKLEELKADIGPSSKNVDGMPFQHTNKTSSPTEQKAIRMAELEKVIEGKMAEIQITILEIENFIVSIDDSYTRIIIQLRCVELKSWEDIASAMGEGYTATAVRQHFSRFIKKL